MGGVLDATAAYLHSIMYLLILKQKQQQNISRKYLHSIMYLLIRVRNPETGRNEVDLHSIMYLLIRDTSGDEEVLSPIYIP